MKRSTHGPPEPKATGSNPVSRAAVTSGKQKGSPGSPRGTRKPAGKPARSQPDLDVVFDGLTARQGQVLRIVVDCTLAGLPPTLRQIGQLAGIRSTNGVDHQLQALVGLGLLARGKRSARDLRLTEEGRRVAGQLDRAAAATATSTGEAVAPKNGAR